MNRRSKLERYLREHMGPETRLLAMTPLGEGLHGTAFRLTYEKEGVPGACILKTLYPHQFGHDHFSDRAQVLLRAHADYNTMEGHVRTLDVLGETPSGMLSLGGAREFYILMEEAKGRSYFEDLEAVRRRGALLPADLSRAEALARVLAEIHGSRHHGRGNRALYRRRIRDLVGHGECIMGILDVYEPVAFASAEELEAYAVSCMRWWWRIRDRRHRLCTVHGDFHPGNLWFEGDRLTLLDRSRGALGEAADDVACLSVNYIHYALKSSPEGFSGPFATLFRRFWDTYMAETGDKEILDVIAPFFAFRVLVVAYPRFYPEDVRETKRRLFQFGISSLRAERFDPDAVSAYVEGP